MVDCSTSFAHDISKLFMDETCLATLNLPVSCPVGVADKFLYEYASDFTVFNQFLEVAFAYGLTVLIFAGEVPRPNSLSGKALCALRLVSQVAAMFFYLFAFFLLVVAYCKATRSPSSACFLRVGSAQLLHVAVAPLALVQPRVAGQVYALIATGIATATTLTMFTRRARQQGQPGQQGQCNSSSSSPGEKRREGAEAWPETEAEAAARAKAEAAEEAEEEEAEAEAQAQTEARAGPTPASASTRTPTPPTPRTPTASTRLATPTPTPIPRKPLPTPTPTPIHASLSLPGSRPGTPAQTPLELPLPLTLSLSLGDIHSRPLTPTPSPSALLRSPTAILAAIAVTGLAATVAYWTATLGPLFTIPFVGVPLFVVPSLYVFSRVASWAEEKTGAFVDVQSLAHAGHLLRGLLILTIAPTCVLGSIFAFTVYRGDGPARDWGRLVEIYRFAFSLGPTRFPNLLGLAEVFSWSSWELALNLVQCLAHIGDCDGGGTDCECEPEPSLILRASVAMTGASFVCTFVKTCVLGSNQCLLAVMGGKFDSVWDAGDNGRTTKDGAKAQALMRKVKPEMGRDKGAMDLPISSLAVSALS